MLCSWLFRYFCIVWFDILLFEKDQTSSDEDEDEDEDEEEMTLEQMRAALRSYEQEEQ